MPHGYDRKAMRWSKIGEIRLPSPILGPRSRKNSPVVTLRTDQNGTFQAFAGTDQQFIPFLEQVKRLSRMGLARLGRKRFGRG
jgi:hypothetical protein